MAGKFRAGDKVTRAIPNAGSVDMQVVSEVEPGMYRVTTNLGLAMLMSERELGVEPDPVPPPPPPPPMEVIIKDDGIKADVSNLKVDVASLKTNVASLTADVDRLELPPVVEPVVGGG